MSWMISIIGAGPAGNYLAYLLAKKGKEVNVFEEHDKIGLPIQCAGIVTNALQDIIPLRDRFVLNKVDKARIFSPNNKYIDIKLKKNFIIDRKEFDRYLAEKAMDNGAKYYLNHKFLNAKFEKKIKLNFDKKEFYTDILVGADGPFSKVAKSAGIFGNRKFVVGLQVRASLDNPGDLLNIYLNKDYFGWTIPENEEIVRVGIVAKKNPNFYFKQFLNNLGEIKIREYQSGVIPVYNSKLKISKKNIYLVGDAAAQVKAVTYGGIVQGLMAAEELSKTILYNKNYRRLCKKRIGKELKYSLFIRKRMDKFSDDDYNYLLHLINQNKIKSILEEYDRDFPSKIIFKLLLKDIRFLRFGLKFWVNFIY